MAHVAIAGPFDFALTTERFRAFGIDRANVWHEGGLHRVVAGRELRIEAAPGGVDANPLDAGTEPVVHALVGLAFDLDGFRTWAAGDEVLATVVPHLAGFRPPLTPDPFEMLVCAITAQHVSLFSALAIRNRLIERFGEQVGEAWAFPARERIAAAGEEELFALGFSRRKAEYTITLARSDLDLEGLATLPDDEVRARLVALPGIGEWTVDWFLARHLARPTAWPAGDLGLRKAVSAFYGNGRAMSTDDVRTFGARFEPFQNLTAHYLLTGLRTAVA